MGYRRRKAERICVGGDALMPRERRQAIFAKPFLRGASVGGMRTTVPSLLPRHPSDDCLKSLPARLPAAATGPVLKKFLSLPIVQQTALASPRTVALPVPVRRPPSRTSKLSRRAVMLSPAKHRASLHDSSDADKLDMLAARV